MPTNNSFDNIPIELIELKQWVLWRLEEVIGAAKPTKIPYNGLGHKASVTNPDDWCSFSDALSIFHKGSYTGIGFVFTAFDPYAFIDLDATDDKENVARQLKIYKEFDSYSEKSPSGKGLHIIVKGAIPQGRKRSDVEIYSSGRYATMTGNIYNLKPIEERHDLLNQLFNQMGGIPKVYNSNNLNEPQNQTDEEIINQATNAVNGYKFNKLYNGEWEEFYPAISAAGQGSSEACFGLIDIISFYTQNRTQIERIFLKSKLGNVKKYDRRELIHTMIEKSFDNQLPKLDFDGHRIQLEEKLQEQIELPLNGSVAQGLEPVAHNGSVVGSNPTASTKPAPAAQAFHNSGERMQNSNTALAGAGTQITPPPGLVGEIAQFIYQAAPRPVPEIAIAAGLGLMAGICGRAYNVSGTGLNQYILCLAMTGAGKEAMASGIDKIINAVQLSVPVAPEFIGPSEIASGQALVKYLANKSQSFVSILGEFGLRLRSMSSERANGAEIALRRMLLDLYNKSGHGQVARPSIYADSEKNTNLIVSPAFSILGESTPERFYDILNEEMISEGLLPRFMLIEYNGARPKLNENAMSVQPPDWLISKISTLMANAKTVMNQRKVIEVGSTDEATELLKSFDYLADSKINTTDKEIIRQLWNRAHIKVLKISALLAVGIHPFNPVISVDDVLWAKQIVENDIRSLSDKFISGEIGRSSEEIKQLSEIKRMIKLYFTQDWSKVKSSSNDERLYHAKIIPYIYLNKRLSNIAAFKQDRIGATNAIKRAIQILIDSDYMREAGKKEMMEKFGTTQRSFIITNMSLLD